MPKGLAMTSSPCYDLITLLGDTEIEADGGPTDPAAWDDWLACVRDVKTGRPLRQPQDS